jgi:hypothetical protein
MKWGRPTTSLAITTGHLQSLIRASRQPGEAAESVGEAVARRRPTDQCKDTKAINSADMRTTAKTAKAISVSSALRMRPEAP